MGKSTDPCGDRLSCPGREDTRLKSCPYITNTIHQVHTGHKLWRTTSAAVCQLNVILRRERSLMQRYSAETGWMWWWINEGRLTLFTRWAAVAEPRRDDLLLALRPLFFTASCLMSHRCAHTECCMCEQMHRCVWLKSVTWLCRCSTSSSLLRVLSCSVSYSSLTSLSSSPSFLTCSSRASSSLRLEPCQHTTQHSLLYVIKMPSEEVSLSV